jgi:hypothetical protein
MRRLKGVLNVQGILGGMTAVLGYLTDASLEVSKLDLLLDLKKQNACKHLAYKRLSDQSEPPVGIEPTTY